MAAEKTMTPVADLTPERLPRLEAKVDEVLSKLVARDHKIDAVIDLAAGSRADFLGFFRLYAA